MNEPDDLLPKSSVPGLIPTLNNTGWMTETLDEVSTTFTEYAGSIDTESLDIGCAYGIATLQALEQGARMCACDSEPQHLEILLKRVPPESADRCRTVTGIMPGVDFAPGSFGAILASRVLHFLTGAEVEQTIGKMHDWLIPGGRVFLVADSPYTGPWKAAAADYERRKAEGDPWPGWLDDYTQYVPDSFNISKSPAPINPMDPDILARACSEAGLEIIEARWLSSGTKYATGKDHAGVIAARPG